MASLDPTSTGTSPGTTVNVHRWTEILAVLILSLSVVGLLTARLGIFEAVPVWVASFLLTFGYQRITAASPTPSTGWVPSWHVALVLGVGLLFRLTPYAWVLGGQDQGVYVNMAMELARTGGLLPIDHVLAGFTDPALEAVYRQSNYGHWAFLPGVYATSGGLVFQFYHLFPVWMALFSEGLGASGAVYALTFLSLVSLLFFQRAAHVVTGSAKAGLVAGLLLAVNPLHAYFSKFPVTEVPTLAFSLMSFAFLLSYWRASGGATDRRLLVLSAAAMGLLFMTRISGFMYLPLVYVLAMVALLFEQRIGKRRGVLLWCAGVICLYAFSVWYGLTWSAPYSNDIYRLSFQPLLGANWSNYLGILLLALVGGWVIVWRVTNTPRVLVVVRRITSGGAKLLPVLALALVVIGLYKIYSFGYTDAYANHPWYGLRYHLAHKGLQSVLSTSLVVSVVYLSPFMVLAFVPAMFLAARDVVLQLLLFFVICFLGYLSILQWGVTYQPYYARYLLSEFVPYLILFVVCSWACCQQLWLKRGLWAALVLSALYCVTLSALQIGKEAQGGVAQSINQLTRDFDSGDAVLVPRLVGNLGTNLATTLIYTHGLNVVRVSDRDLMNGEYLDDLSMRYDDIFLLSTWSGAPISNFDKIDSTRFHNEQFDRGALPPIRTQHSSLRIDVYKYTAPEPMRYTPNGRHGVELLNGWSQQETWGVWTAATSASVKLEPGESDIEAPRMIAISGRVYVTPKNPTQRISILVDGEPIAEHVIKYPERTLVVEIPLSKNNDQSKMLIEIQTPDATSPAVLGHSGDKRTLAFGLEDVRVIQRSR